MPRVVLLVGSRRLLVVPEQWLGDARGGRRAVCRCEEAAHPLATRPLGLPLHSNQTIPVPFQRRHTYRVHFSPLRSRLNFLLQSSLPALPSLPSSPLNLTTKASLFPQKLPPYIPTPTSVHSQSFTFTSQWARTSSRTVSLHPSHLATRASQQLHCLHSPPHLTRSTFCLHLGQFLPPSSLLAHLSMSCRSSTSPTPSYQPHGMLDLNQSLRRRIL